MAQSTKDTTRPIVAIAVRNPVVLEQVSRELRSRVTGAEVTTIVGDRAFRETIARGAAASIDALVADAECAELIAALSRPEDLPLVGVIASETGGTGLPQAIAAAGFPLLRQCSEPRPYAEVAAWVNGVVASLSRAGCRRDSVDYGQRYEDLVQALPDIVYELDVDGVITFINDSVSMLGYVPGDLIGKHYSVLLHDEDAAAVDRDRVLVDYVGYRTGVALSPKLFNERRSIERRTTDLEVRLKRKRGAKNGPPELIGSVISYGEISSAGEYGRDGAKEFKGSVGIIRDVTLRRKSEETLRKLYQAIDQLGSCVFVLNHAFEVEYVNPAFFMLTGFAPPDVIGGNVFRFLAFLPDKVDAIRKRVQDGFEARDEVLVPRMGGGQFWASLSLAPVRTPSGAITHAIAVMDDISSRRSMDELLQGARREAEEASRAKSRFISSMTHELHTPIAGIMAAARSLQGCGGQGDPAALILDNAQRLLDILSGILDYVRSESDDLAVRRVSFQLGPFLERACGPHRAAAEGKGLSFSVEADSGESVESDPDRLGRVVEILLDNAVRYTGSGSIRVTARIERLEGNVPHLIVHVADTGPGIADQDRERVFKPFSKTERALRDASGGSGVGLALARNIMQVLGGEVRLDSRHGAGCDFSLILPTASPVRAEPPGAADYTLLLVDDNEVNLEYMRTLVENRGYRVLSAESAAEAFRALEAHYVDACILDIQMPGYSGIELAKAIRAYAGPRYSPDMPLFAMTAHDTAALGEDAGLFAAVFPKPTDIARLSDAVVATMAEQDRAASAAFPMAFCATGFGRTAAVARMRLEVESAMTALTLALSGTSDARVDIRAEAASLSSVFNRFSCKPGQAKVRQFIEHYSDDDRDALRCLLERIGRILKEGIDAIANLPGGRE